MLEEGNNKSLYLLAEKLSADTEQLLIEASSEEDLRIGFEKLLEPIRRDLQLTVTPKYEKSIYSGGRSDAVHGQVIIEYESPRSFTSKRNVEHALKQLLVYLEGEAKGTDLNKLVGVGFDGAQIFFVHCSGEKEGFSLRGPYKFTPESAQTFLIYLRALSRIPLSADSLALKFGPQSIIAPKAISALVRALKHWGNQTRIHTFFNEWKRLFGIVYGEQAIKEANGRETRALSRIYKVKEDVEFQEFLFCVHTYFAFLMKLITVELLTLRDSSLRSSLVFELAHASDQELKAYLEDIENGGIYARRGITNFLEGDFFRWYLDAFESPELKDIIKEIARTFSDFEPATSILAPDSTRDLLKKLYQYLIPQEVRHSLGEYYTPEWLAELLMKEVGYSGDFRKRILDPACGSGTFLVLAIKQIKNRGEKEGVNPKILAQKILANVWGFDLNPLAVIAARTNYLFALGGLVDKLSYVEIPVYLTDSVLTSNRTKQNIFGESLEVLTSVGKFGIPAEWVKNNFSLSKASTLIEEMVKNDFSEDEAIERLKKEQLADKRNEEVTKQFYSQILSLEKQGRNGIWTRFLKNAFAPVFAGKFDFVVGNPPWISWEFLSKEYREATNSLWEDYQLFPKTKVYGFIKPDFYMLFLYASADYFLKKGAKLGFLVSQELFKSKGTGEGVRKFHIKKAGKYLYLKVLKAHDLASIQPFEGVANKTAAIIIKNGERTRYPVSYTVWKRRKGIGKIPSDKTLDEVSPFLEKKKMKAKPVDSIISPWITYLKKEEGLFKVKGNNYYISLYGVETKPYGVFWVEIKEVLSNGDVIVMNLSGKSRMKIKKVRERVEKELIFPFLRGSDIGKWQATPKYYTFLTHDSTGAIILEGEMKKKFPRTYNYLLKFKKELLAVKAKSTKNAREKKAFYAMFGIYDGTFSKYKVIWGYMGNDIHAAVVSEHKTPFGYKMILPIYTTVFYPTDSLNEAHYLCAITNSEIARKLIKSFSSAGRGFGTPSVMKYVGIPRFNPENSIHKRLSEKSQACHQLKAQGKYKEVERVEKEIDKLVNKLFEEK